VLSSSGGIGLFWGIDDTFSIFAFRELILFRVLCTVSQEAREAKGTMTTTLERAGKVSDFVVEGIGLCNGMDKIFMFERSFTFFAFAVLYHRRQGRRLRLRKGRQR
jgi:hypothetical protein